MSSTTKDNILVQEALKIRYILYVICSFKKVMTNFSTTFIIIFSFLFLALSTTCEPEELVRILNDLFARFDKLASVSTFPRI